MGKATEQIVKVCGNQTSFFIFIPKPFREALKLRKGDYMRIRLDGGRLIIEPLEEREA
jgi:AbrB family looped-hinge helix DNA binding protein